MEIRMMTLPNAVHSSELNQGFCPKGIDQLRC